MPVKFDHQFVLTREHAKVSFVREEDIRPLYEEAKSRGWNTLLYFHEDHDLTCFRCFDGNDMTNFATEGDVNVYDVDRSWKSEISNTVWRKF